MGASRTRCRGAFRVLLSAAALLVACIPAGGQCQAGWSEAFAWPGLATAPGRLGVFDDGTGARLLAGGTFNSAGDLPGTSGLAAWNGVSWTSLSLLPQFPTSVTEARAFVVFDDGSGPALYVGFGSTFFLVNGTFIGAIARWNGSTWSAVGSGLDGPVWALEVFDDGSGPALYAGGSFLNAGPVATSRLARWNGSTWADVGGGISGGNATVLSLRAWNDGTGPALYVSGSFTTAGVIAAANIARWSGSSWSALGAGITGTGAVPVGPYVWNSAVFDDGTAPALYVTGSFSNAGGAAASSIAQWNGAVWSPVGTGINGSGAALAVWNDGLGPSLFVGGGFSTAGGIAAIGVARYGAAGWSAVGTLPGGNLAQPADLVVFDDGTSPALYAVGSFGALSGNIRRWNGTAWSALPGNGADGAPLAFASGDLGSGPTLFAGGAFSSIGGVAASRISAFAHGQWSPLGSGIQAPGVVRALASYDDGGGPALFAGGTFTIAGNAASSSIARWNGSMWTSMAGGVTGPTAIGDQVRTMAVFDDGSGPKLVVGGNFSQAGGITADNLAVWDNGTWLPYGGTPGVQVSALLVGDLGAGQALCIAAQVVNSALGFVGLRVGPTWQILGVTSTAYGPPSGPKSLCIFDDGTGLALYVGGNFYAIDGQPMASVAKWNGVWTSVGPPGSASISGVEALRVYDDGTGPALYASGSPIEFAPTMNLAKMVSPGVWTPVGGDLGTYGGSSAMTVFDDGAGPSLYIGGAFGTAGGLPSHRLAKWGPRRPLIDVTQPGGPGAPVFVTNRWLLKSHEYYNLFSDSPCGGPPGSGPYLGLCASNLGFLLWQFGLPVGSPPIHYNAPVGAVTFGGYQLPPGLTLDALCFDWTTGAACFSNVSRIVVQ